MDMRSRMGAVALLLLASACGSSSAGGKLGAGPAGASSGGAENLTGRGGTVSAGNQTSRGGGAGQAPLAGGPTGLNPDEQQQFDKLRLELQASHSLDAASLLAKRAVREVKALSYDPRKSEFMDRIQASALGLTDDELAHLGTNGFVISQRTAFPTFVRGYAAVYAEHLPVYITADAILEAVHSSYDAILKLTEQTALSRKLGEMLSSMHSRLPELASQNPTSAADLDVYLSVALSLLGGSEVAPLAGGATTTIHELYQLALAPSGWVKQKLFGADREFDSSQFKPRGHYADDPQLSQYFRAMIWLGRTDFRLIETNSDGSQVFLRPQYDAMLLLRQSMSAQDLRSFQAMDAALEAFLGESDYMTVPQVDLLIADLGGVDGARAASDVAVEAAVRAGGYGIQRIASQIMRNDGVVSTLPLARSFAFFGQRYVLDSHVFSQVVYDRTEGRRMMPSALDLAYAAFANDQALPLLAPDLSNEYFRGYPGALEGARVLSDAHGADFWSGNLYNTWVASLRALSPTADVSQPSTRGMPEVSGTNAWGRRILNTQLASWAELRHDTLLYAKQSYTGVPSCDYPDAYVDPYPEFYQRLRQFAEQGVALSDLLGDSLSVDGAPLRNYFTKLAGTLTTLAGMAKNQRDGTPFTAEQMAFVNRAVRIVQRSVVCTTVDAPDGWLSDLYLDPDTSIEASPTIADVHTQPADESGNEVGKVLHVATGYPRQMVTTVDTCMGPRAYVGVTFAYHEQITEDFQRLTDAEWEARLVGGAADVPWLTPVLGH